MAGCLSTEERVAVLKSYYKVENAHEVRRYWFCNSPALSVPAIIDLAKKIEGTE